MILLALNTWKKNYKIPENRSSSKSSGLRAVEHAEKKTIPKSVKKFSYTRWFSTLGTSNLAFSMLCVLQSTQSMDKNV